MRSILGGHTGLVDTVFFEILKTRVGHLRGQAVKKCDLCGKPEISVLAQFSRYGAALSRLIS
jgi:hypothetical protein